MSSSDTKPKDKIKNHLPPVSATVVFFGAAVHFSSIPLDRRTDYNLYAIWLILFLGMSGDGVYHPFR